MREIDPTPLYQRVASHIQSLIEQGVLRPGERIPSVRRLSKQQRVSVFTALHAYRRLEDLGVIEARPQSGYYVKRAAPSVQEPAVSRPPRRPLKVEVNALVDTLFAYAREPGVVAFGSAYPGALPYSVDKIRRLMSANLRSADSLSSYGMPPGTDQLRRAIARRAMDWGGQFDYRNIVTTTSCMEGINLCLRAVTQPGDLVALESPTYFGFFQILQMLGLHALEISTHPRHGISVDELELALDQHPIKAVIAMPDVSNPIGATMSDDAKKRMVDLLASHEVPLIEDHVYADLRFDNSPIRPAKAFDRDGNVMLCSSFTKTVAPGLKSGWIEPGRWSEAVKTHKFISSGGTAEISELALAQFLETGSYERSLRRMRRDFQSRIAIAREIIAESFPAGTRVTQPSGGYILWVELPLPSNAVTLFELALARRITIAPGPMFSASGRYRNCFRIGLGEPWSTQAASALQVLGQIAAQLLENTEGDQVKEPRGRDHGRRG